MDTSYLYFLRSEQAWSKPEIAPRCIIKIGISAKPRARIAAINGGPIAFKFVAAISGSKRNVRRLESGLHGRMESEGLNSNREYHREERSCTDRMIAESAERLASAPIFDIEYFEEPTSEQIG